MNKPNKILITLLLLVSFGWVSAEELTVKVASDRNAVMHITDDGAGDPEVSGTIKGAANLKEGKSGFRADLTLKDAGELQGAEADFYGLVTGKTIEAVGFLDIKVPADEPDAPKVLNINLESITKDDASAANFSMDMQVPLNGEEIPKGEASAKFEGDMKSASMDGKFNFSGPMIKGEEAQITQFTLNIAETGEKTAIKFSVTAPKDSQAAQSFPQMSAFAPMLTGQLDQQGIKYEGVDFPAPKEEGANSVATGAITFVDLRGTLKQYLGIVAMQMQGEMGPDVDVQKVLEDMIQAKLDNFDFTINFAATSVDGTMALKGSDLDKFYGAYIQFLPAINKISQQEMMREAGEFRFILEPLMELSNEQSMRSMKLLLDSSISGTGDFQFSMDSKEGDLVFKASGNAMAKNYGDYVKKAKAEGLPVAETAVAKFDLELKNKTNLVGDMYLFTDGDLAHFYKNMLSQAAAKSNAPDDVKAVIEGFNFEELGFKMTLKDNKLNMESKSKTSDLTPIAAVILKQAAPHLEMDVTGAAVDVNMADGGEGKADVKIFYANFLPGKNEAQIKEALGLPGSATVTLDAPAGDVALVPVEEPALALEGRLASVQTEGKKLMDASPTAVAAGDGSSGGGGGKTGLIVLGVLLLVGVGGFMAFGNKS